MLGLEKGRDGAEVSLGKRDPQPHMDLLIWTQVWAEAGLPLPFLMAGLVLPWKPDGFEGSRSHSVEELASALTF